MVVVLSIIPIALTIFCGYILAQSKILPPDGWGGVEILSFRLLIPVVLVNYIGRSELSVSEFGPMIVVTTAALVLAGLIVLALRLLQTQDNLPNAAFTTLFQTTTRWNAFIALAAAELLIGEKGLVLIAAAMAVLIPLINVANIIILAGFGTAKASPYKILSMIAKNPLVQACFLGIAINLSGIPLPTPITQTLDLIGRAALGVGLLAVGAGIDPARLLRNSSALWLGVLLRLALCPALFLALAFWMGLETTEKLAGVLVLAVPAASNGYIVAKQMGGDANLYADVLAWQTVLSMLLLPLLAVLILV